MRLLCKKGRHAGRVVDYPLHVARRMLDAGTAERVPFDARATDIERAVAVSPEVPEDAAQALPEDFPARDLLVAEGFATLEAVRAASDEDLRAINGVGPKTLDEIRAAQG